MIKKHKLFRLEQKDVHIPSTDYYARPGDSQTETLSVLDYGVCFDTEEEALEEIEERFKNSSYEKDEFVILPVYSKK